MLLMLAGEESGAIYARRIAARAKELFPGVEVRGYGGGIENKIALLKLEGAWK